MTRTALFSCLCLAALGLASCSSDGGHVVSRKVTRITGVRTTAYTHTESDHIIYGARNAVGTQLRYGQVRSAAADWSVFPVGTIFQIEGSPHIYQVDDYGSALVGTNTIDIYQPTKAHMNAWGVRNVNIRVLKWGSFSKSVAILRDRQAYDHVRRMVTRIHRSS
ncbi:MAG: 3D domain-containing protein [Prosthecobacter sp.]|jgi:3D (Asp-Asp-Asp) domain-containing protein|nr:3D domain-containing protein [Prosthecobacter sp.]